MHRDPRGLHEMHPLGLDQRYSAVSRLLFTPGVIVGATLGLIFSYVLIRGPIPFYYESMGTMLLAPAIYVRLLPAPYDHYLLMAFAQNPLGCYLLCFVPVLLLVAAVSCAFHSLRRQSVPAAFTSFGLCGVVFGTYHWLQPLGITFIWE